MRGEELDELCGTLSGVRFVAPPLTADALACCLEHVNIESLAGWPPVQFVDDGPARTWAFLSEQAAFLGLGGAPIPTLKAVSREWAQACRRVLSSESHASGVPLGVLLPMRAPDRLVRARLTSAAGIAEARAEIGDGTRELWIHAALRHRHTEATVLALLEPAPAAIASAWSKERSLPLHLAAAHGASAAVVGRLIDAFPDGAAAKGRGGRLPLHLSLLHGAPSGVALALLGAFPGGAAAFAGDKRLGLPLHLAVEHDAAPEVVRGLLAACPRAARVQCGALGLPLHAAAARGRAEIVEALLASAPEAARIERQRDGLLPLHVAAAGGAACAACADALLKAFPVSHGWSIDQMIRARQCGEATLLELLRGKLADGEGAEGGAEDVAEEEAGAVEAGAMEAGAPRRTMDAAFRDAQLPWRPPSVPTQSERQRVLLLAFDCGAPDRILCELAAGEPGARAAHWVHGWAAAGDARHDHPAFSTEGASNSKMGRGGSYVLPPSVVADDLIAWYKRGDS